MVKDELKIKNSDALIVGGGPAGISAALYLLRAGFTVRVLAHDIGALSKAHLIENYYGLPQAISGRELAENGRRQLQALGGELLELELDSLSWDGGFQLGAGGEQFSAPVLVLAIGAARRKATIPGLAELESRGVSYCAVCDAFFYREKQVAVLGSGAYAANELAELLPVVGSVSLLTNGEPLSFTPPPQVHVDERPLAELLSDEQGLLRAVRFVDGAELNCSGLFVALGTVDATAVARKLGLMVENGLIPVQPDMSTAVPGLFACGDCVSRLKQVSIAVGQGAQAGLSAVDYLRRLRKA